jgi:hypothetical protein
MTFKSPGFQYIVPAIAVHQTTVGYISHGRKAFPLDPDAAGVELTVAHAWEASPPWRTLEGVIVAGDVLFEGLAVDERGVWSTHALRDQEPGAESVTTTSRR